MIFLFKNSNKPDFQILNCDLNPFDLNPLTWQEDPSHPGKRPGIKSLLEHINSQDCGVGGMMVKLFLKYLMYLENPIRYT